MPWSVTSRLIATICTVALVWAAIWYVTDLRDRNSKAKAQIEQLQEQQRETTKAIARSIELQESYAAASEKVAADLRLAQSRRVRLPATNQANSDTAAATGHETQACGLSEADAGALGATLGRIWERSAVIAAEADQCATDLTTLQEWADSVAPNLRQ